MDMEPSKRPRRRLAGDVSGAAGALPGARLRAWSRTLLRLRTAGLPLRLARRPVGCRPQQEGRLARRLRDRLGFVERTERLRASPEATAGTALRRKRKTPAQDRRGRPSGAPLPGVARASRHGLVATACVLG